MEADLHIHTSRYSGCSSIDPVEALVAAKKAGLGLIAFTEHGIRWPDEELGSLVTRSGVEGLVVIPGQEAACYDSTGRFQGEFLVYGFPRSLGSNKSAAQLINMVHSEGGVVIAAHPFKKARWGDGYYGSAHLTRELDVDGLEVEHPSYEDDDRRLALETMELRGIAGTGGSDAHDARAIGLCGTVFVDEIDSVETFCRAVRTGRVKAVKRAFR
jgi:predicted metal-dependent phosphoesterase TrpH